MAVGLDQDTESLQRGSIPSGGAGTLSDGGFKNCFAGVWVYRPSSGNSYGLTAEGSIIHFQAGAREVKLGFDNTFGSGTASDPLLQVIFNSGGGSGATQTFSGANFLDEWVYYFIAENATDGQIAGYIRLSNLSSATTITRTNDNAGSQYINTLTFGNASGNTTAVFGHYAYARAAYDTTNGYDTTDALAFAASSAPGTSWGFWEADDNTDTADTSGNGRTITFNGTLTSETSPSLAGPAPTVTANPTAQRVPAGATATFSASATGATSQQWQSSASGSWVNISGETGTNYTTGTLAAGFAYTVRCGFTNSNGTTYTEPADLWTPVAKPPAMAGLYGRGAGRDLARFNALIPTSEAGALIAADALFGAAPGGGALPVGVATEANSAQALGSSRPAGLASENDTGLALAPVALRTTGLAAESDQALALLPAANGTVGAALESDVAIARGVARPAGLAAESAAALALAGIAIRGVGAAIESDVAIALPALQIRAVGAAIESDAALALNSTGGAAVGLAFETDVAVARGVARPVGAGVESNVALALVPLQVRAVGIAVELDAAISLGGSAGTAVGLAAEIDTALPRGSARPAAAAVETDAALALSASLIRQAGLAAEADVALALAGVQRRDVGLASEEDSALRLFTPGALAVGLALEIDVSLALQAVVIPPARRSSEGARQQLARTVPAATRRPVVSGLRRK